MKTILWITCSLMIMTAYAGHIRVNQLGFYTQQQKLAAVVDCNDSTFEVIDAVSMKTVFSARLKSPRRWASSGETVRIADFSAVNSPGLYVVRVGTTSSGTFVISQRNVYKNLNIWTIKGYYLWRASTPIDSAYAWFGPVNYARAAGHPGTRVIIHPTAASALHPAGSVVAAPGGWYDAGDYNLYTVNANMAVWSLLQLHESFAGMYDTLTLSIPESKNAIPDLLDEVKWELDWLRHMMDSSTGAVYHKLSSLKFCKMIQPAEDTLSRHMIGISTAATLDVAAMLAKASRRFRLYERALPGYADSLLAMSIQAMTWAEKNPRIYYNKDAIDVQTGVYGDSNFDDEFFWARVELFLATGQQQYFDSRYLKAHTFDIPTWDTVNTLGLLSLGACIDTLALPENDKAIVREALFSLADKIMKRISTNPYGVAIEAFDWGSNGYTAMEGAILAMAYTVTKKREYLDGATSVLDYLLGRNALDYCFVTGFGWRSPQFVHDRRSESDNIAPPIPGYLVGGPSTGEKRDCLEIDYMSSFPAKRYTDAPCSFTTNEIAINWNAPITLLTGAIEASLNDFTPPPRPPHTSSTTVINNRLCIVPRYLAAHTNARGDSVVIDFDQEIDSLSAAKVEVSSEGRSLVKNTRVLGKRIHLSIARVHAENTVVLSFSNIRSINGAVVPPVSNQVVTNISGQLPPVPLAVKTGEDGCIVSILFDKEVTGITTVESLKTTAINTIHKKQRNLYLSSPPVFFGHIMRLTYNTKLQVGDSLEIRYEPGKLCSTTGEPIGAFMVRTLPVIYQSQMRCFALRDDTTSTIEAEDYAYNLGMMVGNTRDTSGGKDLIYIEKDDWVEYNIDVKNPGTYQIEVRLSSLRKGTLLVQVPGKPARDSFLDIPVTGSLDKWVTISTSMTFDKGKYLVRFLAKGDKLTLNWMKFSKIGK